MIADAVRMLGESTLTLSAGILFVLIARKLIRIRFGADAAYALWLLVPLMGVVALLPAPVGSITLRILPPVGAQMDLSLPPIAQVARSFDATPWIGAIWLLGVGACAVLLVCQQRRFMRSLGRLSAVSERTVRAEATVGCPALVGAWRPRIVLPADFERRYSEPERELILAHERTHCARGDAQINVLSAAFRCLFWFNPLVHIAASRFRFDQELACDAAVISRFPEARRPYADAMLKAQLAGIGLPAGCYWQPINPLKERIAMLKQPLPGRARRVLGFAVTISISTIGSLVGWAAQPVVDTDSAKFGELARPHATYGNVRPIAYPAAAIAAKVNGEVFVTVHVAVDGSVESVEPNDVTTWKSDDQRPGWHDLVEQHDFRVTEALVNAAISNVRGWTFNPAHNRGYRITTDEVVPVVFRLAPEAFQMQIDNSTLDPVIVAPPGVSTRVSDRDEAGWFQVN